MDKEKATLLEAYVRKAIALSKIRLIEVFQVKGSPVKSDASKEELNIPSKTDTLDELDDIFENVGKFIDCTDSKVCYSFYIIEIPTILIL